MGVIDEGSTGRILSLERCVGALADVMEGCPRVLIGVELADMSVSEHKAMLTTPVEVRTVLIAPLLVFVVVTSLGVFDVPLCRRINDEDDGRAFLHALEAHVPLSIDVVCFRNGVICRYLRMGTAETNGLAIAGSLLRSHRPGTAEYEILIDAYKARWTPTDLLAIAKASDREATCP